MLGTNNWNLSGRKLESRIRSIFSVPHDPIFLRNAENGVTHQLFPHLPVEAFLPTMNEPTYHLVVGGVSPVSSPFFMPQDVEVRTSAQTLGKVWLER